VTPVALPNASYRGSLLRTGQSLLSLQKAYSLDGGFFVAQTESVAAITIT